MIAGCGTGTQVSSSIVATASKADRDHHGAHHARQVRVSPPLPAAAKRCMGNEHACTPPPRACQTHRTQPATRKLTVLTSSRDASPASSRTGRRRSKERRGRHRRRRATPPSAVTAQQSDWSPQRRGQMIDTCTSSWGGDQTLCDCMVNHMAYQIPATEAGSLSPDDARLDVAAVECDAAAKKP